MSTPIEDLKALLRGDTDNGAYRNTEYVSAIEALERTLKQNDDALERYQAENQKLRDDKERLFRDTKKLIAALEDKRRQLWHDVAIAYARSDNSVDPNGVVDWPNNALTAYDKKFPIPPAP